MRKPILLVLCLILALSACGTPSAAMSVPTGLPTPQITPILPTPTAEIFTPNPTLTPTATATPVLNPMSIVAMRMGAYPGSDIVIERELKKGSNYRRYYAYYLSEGLKIYGLLTIPDGEMPAGGWPAIVFNHGYIPPDIYKTTERYIAYVDRLASAGYIVYRIDYRGHDHSEGVANGAYGDPGYEVDVLNAVASLKKYPQVNPDKIGMWGHSMGGYLTLRAMVISKDIKVGVIWAGVVASYPEMLYNWNRRGAFTPSPSSTGVGWRQGWLDLYGTPEQNPDFWASVSATSYLVDLSGPIQLHHGTLDEDVPLDFSIRLAELARAAGKTAELYTYEGDNHNISKYFTTAMNRTIAFFDKYLK
jgi:uncharacterized protein